jgi:hypothetical protein
MMFTICCGNLPPLTVVIAVRFISTATGRSLISSVFISILQGQISQSAMSEPVLRVSPRLDEDQGKVRAERLRPR